MKTKIIAKLSVIAAGLLLSALSASAVDLLAQYPTDLTKGDMEHARPWEFKPEDIFHVSQFNLSVGDKLTVTLGSADLGIGHTTNGAVWAVLIPREEGTLTSSASGEKETIANVWLRFHPSKLNELFPPDTVSTDGDKSVETKIKKVASVKMGSSWQSDGQAIIPELKDLTVYVDTKAGDRRFFVVDTEAKTAEYVASFNRKFDSGIQVSATSIPPVVVKTEPESGAADVAPGETEIKVTFSKPMRDGSWSWASAWQDSTPEITGKPTYDADGKTCVVKAKLEAGKTYGFWLNSERFKNFKDKQGRPAVPYLLVFQTSGQAAESEAQPPKIVSMTPVNGSTDVDPNVTEIKVTFDQPMQDGSWSMTGGGAHFPESAGDLHYDSSHTTWTAPVKLRPGWRYEFGLNSSKYQNFRSAKGVSLEPVYVTFQTGGQSSEPTELPPKIVSMTPPNGATGVDPNLTEIKVVFDQPMQDGSWSMCTSDTNTNFPAGPGPCSYDSTRTVWTFPVSPLHRGTTYEFWLNEGSFRNFRSAQGVSLDPVQASFTTAQ